MELIRLCMPILTRSSLISLLNWDIVDRMIQVQSFPRTILYPRHANTAVGMTID